MTHTVSYITQRLLRRGVISWEDVDKILAASSPEEMCETACVFYKAGKISASEHDSLVRSLQAKVAARDADNLMAKKKARMREAERYAIGSGRGSAVAQGGLPSLGKRRP